MYENDSMFILLYIWYCTINWYRLPDYEKLSPRLLLLPTVRIGNITQLFTLHYISHQHQDDKEQPLKNRDKNKEKMDHCFTFYITLKPCNFWYKNFYFFFVEDQTSSPDDTYLYCVQDLDLREMNRLVVVTPWSFSLNRELHIIVIAACGIPFLLLIFRQLHCRPEVAFSEDIRIIK